MAKRQSKLDDISLSRFEREWSTLLALADRAVRDKPGHELLQPLVQRYLGRGNTSVIDRAIENGGPVHAECLMDTAMDAMVNLPIRPSLLRDGANAQVQRLFAVPLIFLRTHSGLAPLDPDIGYAAAELAQTIQRCEFFPGTQQVVMEPGLRQPWMLPTNAKDLLMLSRSLLGELGRNSPVAPDFDFPIDCGEYWIESHPLAAVIAVGSLIGSASNNGHASASDSDDQEWTRDWHQSVGQAFSELPASDYKLVAHRTPISLSVAGMAVRELALATVLGHLAELIGDGEISQTCLQSVDGTLQDGEPRDGAIRITVETVDGGLHGAEIDSNGLTLDEVEDLEPLLQEFRSLTPDLIPESVVDRIFNSPILIEPAPGRYAGDGVPIYSLPKPEDIVPPDMEAWDDEDWELGAQSGPPESGRLH